MNFPTPRIQNSYVITYEKKVWGPVQCLLCLLSQGGIPGGSRSGSQIQGGGDPSSPPGRPWRFAPGGYPRGGADPIPKSKGGGAPPAPPAGGERINTEYMYQPNVLNCCPNASDRL